MQGEVQILDYQSQQHKLLPQIATVFAVTFAARNAWETYNDVTHNITEGNLEKLPELHALSCGLKAACSRDCTAGVETCRLSCGGHGYLSSSNLPRILTTTTAAQTYEGENTVMWLQLARYLVKMFKEGRSGKVKLAPSVAYFATPPQRSQEQNPLSDYGLLHGWEASTLLLLEQLVSKTEALNAAGLHPDNARNSTALLAEHAAQVFIAGHMCRVFVRSVANSSLSPGTSIILQQLCRLYLLFHVRDKADVFLRSGWLTSYDLASLEDEYCELLNLLRHQAVNLVDAFDIHDKILDSTLGCWDGEVYNRIYETAMKSPLNQKDITDAYKKYLQPLLKPKL